ncbi:MAG: DUF3144 domain-containing protein [Bacteroidia bacterium]|nr:DUF3144 domain-containing protein [Bacteroidia bacterium]
MNKEKEELTRTEMVDKFIALANEFALKASKEHVGAAIMFAASRYNAYEASGKSKNMVADKSDILTWYSNEYRRMLNANLDDLIDIQS